MMMFWLAVMFCVVGMFGHKAMPAIFGKDMVKKIMFVMGGFCAFVYFMNTFM